MKSNEGALISPDVEGWRVVEGGHAPRHFPTLTEATAALHVRTAVRLALPCQDVLLERMKLPATNRDELAGMLQLQLEKTLPFPVEEVSNDFEVINSEENESTLLSVSALSKQLDTLCQPLREKARLPEKITLFAMHVAAACPADQTVLAIYAEQGQTVAAVCESGKLSWAETVPGLDVDALLDELPRLLLAAEMDGVPTHFTSIRLANGLEAFRERLQDYFEVPVELLSLDAPLPEPKGNLVPPAWQADSKRAERAELIKQRLLLGAVVYLLLVAVAFVYLAWLKRKAQGVNLYFAQVQPQLDFIVTREARWNKLRMAIDPRYYSVEVLYQAQKNLPSDGVRITSYSQAVTDDRQEWTLEGEAPAASLAIEYSDKLKDEKELQNWQIVSGSPMLLKDERAKFIIKGQP